MVAMILNWLKYKLNMIAGVESFIESVLWRIHIDAGKLIDKRLPASFDLGFHQVDHPPGMSCFQHMDPTFTKKRSKSHINNP